MRPLLLLLGLLVLCLNSQAQTAIQLKNDSLFKVWALEIVQALREDPQAAKTLARTFVITADTGNFSEERQAPFHARQILAAIYGRTGAQDSAILMQKQCLRYAEKAEDTYLIGSSYHNIGVGYGKAGYTLTAQEYLDSAIIFRQKARNVIGLLHSYSLQMGLLNDEEEHSTMLVIGRRALAILDTVTPRQAAMQATLDELGASLLNALGNALRSSGAIDSAQAVYQRALIRCQRSGLEALQLDIEENQVDLLIQQKAYPLALQLLRKMEQQANDLELEYYQLPIALSRLRIHLMTKQWAPAETIWKNWKDSLPTLEDPALLLEAWQLAERLYRATGALDLALLYTDQIDSLNQATYQAKKRLRSEELSQRFELQANRMNLAFQEEKIALQEEVIHAEKRRNWFFGIAAILFVMLFGVAIFSRNRLAQQKKKEELLNTQLQELIRFQQQVSTTLSHDIRNYSAALDIGPDLALRQLREGNQVAAEEMLIQLSDRLHSLHQSVSNILVWASPQLRMGAQENFQTIAFPAWLEKHLSGILPMAQSKGMQLQWSGEPMQFSLNVLCLEVILRNALFNAIKHSEAQNVSIQWQRAPEKFILVLEDNGKGMSPDHAERFQLSTDAMEKVWRQTGSGFGLWIMRLYAEIAQAELRYERLDGVSRFTFVFPLQP